MVNFGPQTKKLYGAHIGPPQVRFQCNLTQFHSPCTWF